MKKNLVTVVILLVLSATTAYTEEHFGVTVYPGAKADTAAKAYCSKFGPESVRQMKEMFKSSVDGGTFCYRTNDEFNKVVEYYRKHKGIEAMGAPSERGNNKAMVFCKQGMQCASMGDGVDISVSTPWPVGPTVYKDVLITIRKASPK